MASYIAVIEPIDLSVDYRRHKLPADAIAEAREMRLERPDATIAVYGWDKMPASREGVVDTWKDYALTRRGTLNKAGELE
jgi:hypothetical protein